jgi:ribosomal protein S18 acetylase RimI-like enzyme
MTDRSSDMRHILSQIRTLTGEPLLTESGDHTSSVALKGGLTLDLSIRQRRSGRYTFTGAINGESAVTGEFQRETFGDKGSVEEIVVSPKFRRIGVATAVYDAFTEMGFRVVPSDDVRPDGQRFWSSRSRW